MLDANERMCKNEEMRSFVHDLVDVKTSVCTRNEANARSNIGRKKETIIVDIIFFWQTP